MWRTVIMRTEEDNRRIETRKVSVITTGTIGDPSAISITNIQFEDKEGYEWNFIIAPEYGRIIYALAYHTRYQGYDNLIINLPTWDDGLEFKYKGIRVMENCSRVNWS